MERFIKGDVIVINYPFTDLSNLKRRPALVLSNVDYQDIIICQITSKKFDDNCISIKENDFSEGKLNQTSFARPNKIVTLDSRLVQYKIGSLKNSKINEIIDSLINLFNSNRIA